MRVMGIDPGLVRTGWAVVDAASARRPMVVAHGVIAPPPAESLPARLKDGAAQLRAVLGAYAPQLVALEEVFTAPRHPRSALLMAHMRGVICLVLEEASVPMLPLTATTVKQRLTGSGHASKEQVQRMVLQLTGLHITGRVRLDETDALALALAGLHQRPMTHTPALPAYAGRAPGRLPPELLARRYSVPRREPGPPLPEGR